MGGIFVEFSPFCKGFRPFCPFDVELLFLLAFPLCFNSQLECSCRRHPCWAKFLIDLRVEVVYKVFSAVVAQDVIAGDVEVTAGFISKKRKPHEAKPLVTDLFFGVRGCSLGLLQENARFDVCAKFDRGTLGF